ncbi:unnamed protein product [Musa banksii]
MALLLIMTLERKTCSSVSIMGIGVEFVVLNGPCCQGRYFGSGGQDKLVHIWDACMPVSRDHPRQRQWLHRISSHTSIVKAVDWCPTRSNLLASGGGCNDHCVKFWNTINGACLNSIDAGSEVCALLWDKNKSELLTSHGSPNNQLTLWNYPSMTRVAEVSDHSSRVLSLAGSPLGGVVASAAADETVRSVVGNIAMGSFVVSKRQHIFIQAHGFEIFKYERNRLR